MKKEKVMELINNLDFENNISLDRYLMFIKRVTIDYKKPTELNQEQDDTVKYLYGEYSKIKNDQDIENDDLLNPELSLVLELRKKIFLYACLAGNDNIGLADILELNLDEFWNDQIEESFKYYNDEITKLKI